MSTFATTSSLFSSGRCVGTRRESVKPQGRKTFQFLSPQTTCEKRGIVNGYSGILINVHVGMWFTSGMLLEKCYRIVWRFYNRVIDILLELFIYVGTNFQLYDIYFKFLNTLRFHQRKIYLFLADKKISSFDF